MMVATAPGDEYEHYYDHFDNETNGGIVFDENLLAMVELPLQTLTESEKRARLRWIKQLRTIASYYTRMTVPKVQSSADILRHRILPPCLAVRNPSTRSGPTEKRTGRRYPPVIEQWDTFGPCVAEFRPEEIRPADDSIADLDDTPFTFSLRFGDQQEVRSEAQELFFLAAVINKFLGKARYLRLVTSGSPVTGRPDGTS
jgi:hypothetical protein